MFIDLQTTFDGSTTAAGVKSGSAVTATAISANVVDLRQAASPALADEGISGPETWFIVQSAGSADFAAAGAATLTITLGSGSAATRAVSRCGVRGGRAVGGARVADDGEERCGGQPGCAEVVRAGERRRTCRGRNLPAR